MLNPFRKGGDPHPLVVGMVGVKMGERLLQIGCAHGGRLGAVALKVGLSGRAVAIVPDQASQARATKGAAEAGVLVEVEIAPPTRLPIDDAGFDVAVIDDTGGFLSTMPADDRSATIREVLRTLRPGGRVMVVANGFRGGLGALLGRQPPLNLDVAPALQAGGFKSVRTIAEREGLVFVEGIKPRSVST